MKVFGWLSACLLLAGSALAQDPVKWKFATKKIDSKTYEVHITATVDKPWHLYSQSSPADGPLPTKIQFTKNPLLTLDGKTKELGEVKDTYEEVFAVTVKYFAGGADFVQVVKLKNDKIKTNLAGSVEFMACNDEQCLPPKTISFNIPINQAN
jgi:hypothetical protein